MSVSVDRFATAFLLALSLASPLWSQDYEDDDGALAQAGMWTVPGGAASGGGETSSTPLRNRPVLRWSYEPEGTLHSEPLVWGNRLLIEVDKGRNKRSLWTLDLASGLPCSKASHFKSDLPLSPSIWGGQAAVRTNPDRIEIRSWTRSGLGPPRTLPAPGAGPPLLFQDELYYVDKLGLHCVNRVTGAESALMEGEFGGRPSLRGGDVYVLEYGAADTVVLVEAERDTLIRKRSISLGRYKGDFEDATIVAYEKWVGVHTKAGLEPFPGKKLEGYVTKRPVRDTSWDFASDFYGSGRPAENVRGIPATWREGWVGWAKARQIEWEITEEDEEEFSLEIIEGDMVEVLIADADAGKTRPIFADDTVHPEFAKLGPAPTVAGDVAYLDGHGIDLIHGRILWQITPAPVSRMVPAGQLLLADLGDGKLSALGASRPAGDGVVAAPYHDPGSFRGLALGLSGERMEGEMSFSDGRLSIGKRSKKLEDLLVVEDQSGRLLWSAGPEAARRGIGLLAERELASALVELAEAAKDSNDAELLARLSDRAVSCGAEEKELKSVVKAVKGLNRRPKPADVKAVEATLEQEASLDGIPADAIVRRLQASDAELPINVRLALLAEALAADPKHPGATEMVDALLPGDLEVGDASSAAEWIPFLDVIERFTVQVWSAGEDTAPPGTQRVIDAVADDWRKDLVAFGSDNMLVLCPPGRPGAVARCVAMGELVCRVLEDIAALGTPVRDKNDDRLVVKLFESREEYLRGGKSDPEPGLEWTAGFYSPTEKLSHLYLEESGEGMEEAMRTFAHESTHHWLDVRCRLWEPLEPGAAMDQDGFWIVEGFACLVEDFLFDLDAGTWETLNPRSSRLDTLAQLDDETVLDWGELLSRSQNGFHKYEKNGGPQVTSSWYLSRIGEASEALRFYAQAAATTQWLYHAEDGALRPKLVEYLVGYYSKEGKSLDTIVGRSWEEIGQSIEAFAKETIGR